MTPNSVHRGRTFADNVSCPGYAAVSTPGIVPDRITWAVWGVTQSTTVKRVAHGPSNFVKQLPVRSWSHEYVPGASRDSVVVIVGDGVGVGVARETVMTEPPANPNRPATTARPPTRSQNLLEAKIRKTDGSEVRVARLFDAFLGPGVSINHDADADNDGAGLLQGRDGGQRRTASRGRVFKNDDALAGDVWSLDLSPSTMIFWLFSHDERIIGTTARGTLVEDRGGNRIRTHRETANRVHVDDLATACVAAIERPVEGVFNVGDGDHSSTAVFLEATARLAGLPPPELVSLAEAPGRISPGMLAYLVESRRVDARRMREELGVTPRYETVAAGVEASLAEMRARGP